MERTENMLGKKPSDPLLSELAKLAAVSAWSASVMSFGLPKVEKRYLSICDSGRWIEIDVAAIECEKCVQYSDARLQHRDAVAYVNECLIGGIIDVRGETLGIPGARYWERTFVIRSFTVSPGGMACAVASMNLDPLDNEVRFISDAGDVVCTLKDNRSH
jgi:hypothetical protein